MINIKTILSASAALTLAACGGGGGNGSPDIDDITSTADYNQLVAALADFEADTVPSDDFRNHTTPLAQMPSSGKATYAGVGIVDVSGGRDTDDPQLAGISRVTADFGAGTIDARLNGFKSAPGVTTTGGDIRAAGSISGNEIAGRLSGSVNVNGADHGINGPANGAFFDNDADAVAVGGEGVTSRGTDYIVAIAAEDID